MPLRCRSWRFHVSGSPLVFLLFQSCLRAALSSTYTCSPRQGWPATVPTSQHRATGNQFGGTEPGTNAEIKDLVRNTYNATFPLFSKVRERDVGLSPNSSVSLWLPGPYRSIQRPRKAKGKGIKQKKDHPAETAWLRPDAQVDVKGAGAHPVWRFLISNQPSHHGYPGATGTATGGILLCRQIYQTVETSSVSRSQPCLTPFSDWRLLSYLRSRLGLEF